MQCVAELFVDGAALAARLPRWRVVHSEGL